MTVPPRESTDRKGEVAEHCSSAQTTPDRAQIRLDTRTHAADQACDERVTFRITPATWLIAALLVVVGGSSAAGWATVPTLAALSTSSQNTDGFLQASSIRLSANPGSTPAFEVPALLPGETIDRVFTITQGGTTDASLTLDVSAFSPSRLATDVEAGLQLEISRCVAGAWVTASVPTPPNAYECVGQGQGIAASVSSVYRGPIIPRSSVTSMAPAGIRIADRVAPGETVELRLRTSLPLGAQEWANQGLASPSDRSASITLEWRAIPVVSNLSGSALATQVASVIQSTPQATVMPISVPATPVPPAPTPFPEPTATTQPTIEMQPAGYPGYAIALDGDGDAIELGGSPSPLASLNAWTIEAWIRPDTFVGAQAIYTENIAISNGAAGMVLGLGLLDRKLVVGGWSDTEQSSWAWNEATVPGEVAPATWFHVAAVRSGSTVEIIVNGNPLTTTSTGASAWTSLSSAVPSTFYVGRAGNPGEASYFRGQIDDVRLWTTARTSNQVSTARRQRLWGNETGLGTYLPMSGYPMTSVDGRGTSVPNMVTGSQTGLLRGGVRFVASGAGIVLPPTPYQLALASSSDSGTIGDRITNAAVATVIGVAEAGSSVTLYRNGIALSPNVIAGPDGTFNVNAPLPSDGSYTFNATSRIGNGAESLPSSAIEVTRDATPPIAPTISFSVSTTGLVSFSGTSVSGTHLALDIDGSLVFAWVSFGAWNQAYLSPLGAGTHTSRITSTDGAGNSSFALISFNLTPNYGAPVEIIFTGALPNSSTASHTHYWIAPEAGWVIVDTCGSNFDTVITAFSITNDDGANILGCSLASLVRAWVTADVEYPITIRPYSSNGGSYKIQIRYG